MAETRRDLGVHGADVPTLLDRWARQGLLSQEQVERILRFERSAPEPVVPAPREGEATVAPPPAPTPPAPRGGRLVVEALAYLGGVLTLAAALLLVQMVWDDLSTGARLAVPLVAAAALLLAGQLVPGDAAERVRLRSVLWLLGTGAWLATAAIFGDQVLDWTGEHTFLLTGIAGVALAAPLYLRARTELQQLGLFVTLAMTAAAVGVQANWDEPTLAGLGVWLVALAWFGLGERKLLGPMPAVRYTGAVALIIGAMMMQGSLGGQLAALATIALLFAWGVRVDSLGLLAVAALGTLMLVPASITYFFPDEEIAAPLALLAVGAVLVGSAVVVTRRRARGHAGETPPPSSQDVSRR
jgi:hypothetical protein